MLLIVGSVVTGLALGLRYRVFVLLPAILAGAFAICAISPEPLWQMWTSVLTFAVVVQISYVGGALARLGTQGGVVVEIPSQLRQS